MSDKLIIFGGRTAATYLNDIHVLDLGKINLWLQEAVLMVVG